MDYRPIDVVIHCGDLTEESKLSEFHTTLALLKELDAPLKLVIAGNHDFTLDVPTFRKKAVDAQARESISPELIRNVYGGFGEARQLFDACKRVGITFLDEGAHHFVLANGAALTVFASPYTRSLSANWGFQYRTGEEHPAFDAIPASAADVVITHGPPQGILDYTDDNRRAGCPALFRAVARSRPRLHCFGHIHEGWGARLVQWRGSGASTDPTFFADIDHGASVSMRRLVDLKASRFDAPEEAEGKRRRRVDLLEKGTADVECCEEDEHPLGERGERTLFVNAAIQGVDEEMPAHVPWVVDIELPMAQG
ncbi:Calcineurin-like phosphoesterase [Pleurostoma richardsiae]|uniref:Calcineurin-like phosphoesterase n=1 Tax=Pleurostoma richardsiae TaxID=41990 RepID=A0AA38VHE4_9PEZI|nr:Calcineurin-like phosphoesterase [Pleurostoma richardsiae]